MKQQIDKFSYSYSQLMRTIALRVWSKGSQKECADFLGISPSNLSRILTCTVACHSTLFVRLLGYCDMCIFASFKTPEGEYYPGVNLDDYFPVKY